MSFLFTEVVSRLGAIFLAGAIAWAFTRVCVGDQERRDFLRAIFSLLVVAIALVSVPTEAAWRGFSNPWVWTALSMLLLVGSLVIVGALMAAYREFGEELQPRRTLRKLARASPLLGLVPILLVGTGLLAHACFWPNDFEIVLTGLQHDQDFRINVRQWFDEYESRSGRISVTPVEELVDTEMDASKLLSDRSAEIVIYGGLTEEARAVCSKLRILDRWGYLQFERIPCTEQQIQEFVEGPYVKEALAEMVFGSTLYSLGIVHLGSGELLETLHDFSDLWQWSRRFGHPASQELAIQLLDKKGYPRIWSDERFSDDAIHAAFTRLIEERADDSSVHHFLGVYHFILKRYPEAEQAFNEAIDREPQFPRAHVMAASSALFDQRPCDALAYIREFESGGGMLRQSDDLAMKAQAESSCAEEDAR